MNPAIMYHHAEVAASWMDRGDDVNEAQAVRQLIAEHKALTAERDELMQSLQRIADSSENSSVRGLQMSAVRAIEKVAGVKTEGGAS